MKVLGHDPETLILHQSDIKDFRQCPDQFRQTRGIQPGGVFDPADKIRMETDAATVGTTLHACIEEDVRTGFKSKAAAQKWAREFMGLLVFSYYESQTTYRTESFGDNPAKALDALDRLVSAWWDSAERVRLLRIVRDDPSMLLLEQDFEVPFIQNRKGKFKNIRLAGQIDLVDKANHRVVDYKSSSSDHQYKRWEKQRWDPQSTVYTFAAAVMGWIERQSQGYQFDFRLFTYKPGQPYIELSVWRDQGQWTWLTQVVSNMVAMIESDLEVWPLRDDHALCGPKWCPVWSTCKGTFVDEEWR